MEVMLQHAGWKCNAVHGDKGQRDREAAVDAFKAGTAPLLIATDVAARGLDTPDVEVRQGQTKQKGLSASVWLTPRAAVPFSEHRSNPLVTRTSIPATCCKVVINYSFPLTIEDYVHRIGRTGRAGKTGIAHTFFHEGDKSHAGELQGVLKNADMPVPPALLQWGTATKKKQDKTYGAFFKDVDMSVKGKKTTFGSDSDSD